LITANIGQPAPSFIVSDWVQGEPTHFDQLAGNVVLVEVFQVNCPGCFLYALPQAIDLHHRYADNGLAVLGIATAFEDFELNTLENLHKLINHGEVIGETLRMLNQHGVLKADRLPYRIPFPVAMDKLVQREAEISHDDVIALINEQLPTFDQQPEAHRQQIITQARTYLEKLPYRPQTFELFNLKGTPSYILVDKQGIIRDCGFGTNSDLESQVLMLLEE
jgi:AhpC/TSA family